MFVPEVGGAVEDPGSKVVEEPADGRSSEQWFIVTVHFRCF